MTREAIRLSNTSEILKMIWISKAVSRIAISKELGIVKSTVTIIVSRLLKKKIIVEKKRLNSSPKGGRKPILLKLNKAFGFAAGIELYPDFYRAVLVNLNGEIEYSFHDKQLINKSNIVDIILEIVSKLISFNSNTELICTGLALPGIINSFSGEITQSIPLDIYNFNLRQELEKYFIFPIVIENDANACCLGELFFNRRENPDNFIFLLGRFNGAFSSTTKKNGIGIGFVFNGKIYYGQDNSAGEFTEIHINNDNKKIQVSFTPDDLLVSDSADLLSDHVAFLVNTLNLQHIYIGGELMKGKEIFSLRLQESIRENWAYEKRNRCHIYDSSFGEHAAAYGAAGKALNNLFYDNKFIHQLYY